MFIEERCVFMVTTFSVYEKEYEIKYYEQNLKGFLKEACLLNFLQDAATLSAETLGFGPSFVFENNYAWVVLRYHIEQYKPLKDLDSIKVRTEPRGVSKLYAFRDFEFYTKSGDLLGKAISTWALIDKNSRRVLPTAKCLPMMLPFEKRETDIEYGKIEDLENISTSSLFYVRFDDIDVNLHANNSNYLIWALESLSDEYRQNYHTQTIDIKYRKEISLGGKVLVETEIINDTTLHLIKNKEDDETLCSIKIQWAKT